MFNFSRDNTSTIAKWWRNVDKEILISFVFLFLLGLFFSFSSTSSVVGEKMNKQTYFFFIKHLFFVCISLFLLVAISIQDKRTLIKFLPYIFFISLLVLSLVPLFGAEVKGHCSKLEGIDLSNKMLAIAAQKNIYDKLSQGDILEYLSNTSLSFDNIIAADVFVYIGDLSEVFRLIKSGNRKPGQLVFSTEHTENDGYHLLETGRFAHSKSYISSLCKKFDYEEIYFTMTDLRKRKGEFIKGGLYILSFTP